MDPSDAWRVSRAVLCTQPSTLDRPPEKGGRTSAPNHAGMEETETETDPLGKTPPPFFFVCFFSLNFFFFVFVVVCVDVNTRQKPCETERNKTILPQPPPQHGTATPPERSRPRCLPDCCASNTSSAPRIQGRSGRSHYGHGRPTEGSPARGVGDGKGESIGQEGPPSSPRFPLSSPAPPPPPSLPPSIFFFGFLLWWVWRCSGQGVRLWTIRAHVLQAPPNQIEGPRVHHALCAGSPIVDVFRMRHLVQTAGQAVSDLEVALGTIRHHNGLLFFFFLSLYLAHRSQMDCLAAVQANPPPTPPPLTKPPPSLYSLQSSLAWGLALALGVRSVREMGLKLRALTHRSSWHRCCNAPVAWILGKDSGGPTALEAVVMSGRK